jgi:predicted transcriptional regulator with HTH domain
MLTFIDSEEWIELESFRNKTAEVAMTFGKKILSYEEKKNKKRDERISAGLPIGFEEYKSKMRYKGHFLAFMRKDGKLDGALAFLRFVNLTKNKNGNVLIGLTDAGVHFARLENPVIDHNNFDTSLSEKEISFYLSHVSRNVRGEFAAIKWLLGKLSNGITHREEINRELKKEFGDLWEASDAVINTQKAGLMARMIELGLIDRVRKGIRVYYYISDRGKTFLKEAKSRY